jgi:hypothetical protein
MDININKIINDLINERVKELIASSFNNEINSIVQQSIGQIKGRLDDIIEHNKRRETIVIPNAEPMRYVNMNEDPDSVLTSEAEYEITRTALQTFDIDKNKKPNARCPNRRY